MATHSGIQRVPEKLAEFVAGKEPDALSLWEASCGFCRWPVDVLFDGRGMTYLHDLQAGCVLNFCYQGSEEMSVKVFNDTSCRRHYHSDDDEDDS
ncbi:hypothetical protein QYE76_061074 [Lolium multiflorum]|uniref:Uncharacterized protein n=1 Tax=Lolium multiflorum TaxID=4521 RepID=A0AAD8S0Z6_LOLMU|nr:hypothetical protein QYE76_061074 [Lolium multiflorum]